MVLFDQLRISDDGKRLYINAHVNKADPFKDVTIESLTIMTAMNDAGTMQVSETDPYAPTDNYIYKKVFTDHPKEVSLVIDKNALNEAFNNTNSSGEAISKNKPTAKVDFSHKDFTNDLFFVYITCTPMDEQTAINCCIPCSMREETTLGVTFDYNKLYQAVMNFTKELAEDCEIPKNFIDFILQWDAFKAAVDTEHYVPAVKFYNNLFGGRDSITGLGGTKGCGCHG